MRKITCDTIKQLGVAPNLKGYLYLRDMIDAHVDTMGDYTKILRAIAQRYDTTTSCVERAARHAIHAGWRYHVRTISEDIFCGLLQSHSDIPSVSLFVCSVAEYVRLHIDDDNARRELLCF